MLLERMQRVSLLRKLVGRPGLRVLCLMWETIPASMKNWHSGRRLGQFIYRLIQMRSQREMSLFTRFLRNRAELEEYARLFSGYATGASVRLIVVGCSTGAEIFSIVWRLRKARPDLTIEAVAIDIDESCVNIGREARYSINSPEIQGPPERNLALSEAEIATLFDREGDTLVVKHSIRSGITWYAGDLADPELNLRLGLFDLVVANNILIHMEHDVALHYFRILTKIVLPGGYLFVSGVDLDVRAKAAKELQLEPISDHMENLHNENSLTLEWPMHYWGLEPIDVNRRDVVYRYCPLFRVGQLETRPP
jgi:chemotaxis methyl-accepting protein methylase